MARSIRSRPGGRASAIRAAVLELGRASLIAAALVGIYTVMAQKRECLGFYTCTRVLDRTLLLGWTATVVATGVTLVLAVLIPMCAQWATWSRYAVRGCLGLGAIALVIAYRITQFPSLRGAMAVVMTPSVSMWTASWALWFTVLGCLATALTVGKDTTRLYRPALLGVAIAASTILANMVWR